jgi:hypothetical protein
MLVPPMTTWPLSILSDRNRARAPDERAETIIAPGAARSGLRVPSRSGPSLLKSVMSCSSWSTSWRVPSMSSHSLRVV